MLNWFSKWDFYMQKKKILLCILYVLLTIKTIWLQRGFIFKYLFTKLSRKEKNNNVAHESFTPVRSCLWRHIRNKRNWSISFFPFPSDPLLIEFLVFYFSFILFLQFKYITYSRITKIFYDSSRCFRLFWIGNLELCL